MDSRSGSTLVRSMKTNRKALLAIAALIASTIALLAIIRVSQPSTASAATSVAVAPTRAQPALQPVAVGGHDAELALAVHDLDAGATCTDRLAAVQRLIELRDPNAVSALRSARVRKDNACLRGAAAQAIKTLDGRI